MSIGFFDIETNGIRPSKVWCIVVNEELFTDIPEGLKYLDTFDYVCGHNVIGYDLPVLKRLYGYQVDENKIIDTLVMSRLANPQREGGNSLGAWGQRLGFPKGDFCDWTGGFTEEMGIYCKQDVLVTMKLYDHLLTELEGFEEWSLKLERKVAVAIQEQIENGWVFDERKATDLMAELVERKAQLETEVHKRFLPKRIVTKLKRVLTKAGKVSRMAEVVGGDGSKSRLSDDEHAAIQDQEIIERVRMEPFNLGSRQQIGEYLQEFGWKPKEYTETGKPKVSEEVLMGIKGIPEGELIAEYLLVQKRMGMVSSWLDHLEDDGRVHGRVNSCGAVTGRMTHSTPNVAQVPSGRSPYGRQCRECWTVPEGYTLVGVDAAGLELRMLAHYMEDEEYINEVSNPEGDVHSKNQIAAGLPTRDDAKTFIYAFLYGAGDEKIGSIVGKGPREGARIKHRFLEQTPALAALRRDVGSAAARGYLRGLDGRRLWVRSEHAALNTLLQGAGAVVMKQALVLLREYVKQYNLDAKPCGNIHDEFQWEVKEEDSEFFGSLAVGAIVMAGKQFDLRCPLAGEAKYGRTWYDTH